MKASAECLNFIQDYEKLRLFAFMPTPTDVPTIGWGHTKGVKLGDVCTIRQADAWFNEDVAIIELGVERLVTVPINQCMFDALVSFAYNVGLDEDADTKAEGLGDSTLLKLLNDGRYSDAAAEFPKWNKQKGKVLNGLTERRLKEQTMFCQQSLVYDS